MLSGAWIGEPRGRHMGGLGIMIGMHYGTMAVTRQAYCATYLRMRLTLAAHMHWSGALV